MCSTRSISHVGSRQEDRRGSLSPSDGTPLRQRRREATKVGQALLRYTTPQEDEIIRRRHAAGDEIARQTARELEPPGFEPKPEPSGPEPTLTPEEEAEFDEFMRRVYARAGISMP